MTDLVSQLVGALEELLHECEQGIATSHHASIEARAALSAAKAGGWVAVPVEPTPEMLEAMVVGVWQRISERPNTRMGDAYAALLAARPLPAPPAQKDPT